jgi:hypothetical protein
MSSLQTVYVYQVSARNDSIIWFNVNNNRDRREVVGNSQTRMLQCKLTVSIVHL